jgi:hypothetical protein
MPSHSLRPRVVISLVLALVAIVTVMARESLLRTAGQLLVASDPLASADIIVLTLDAGGGGALEAADLVHRGVAARVALFTEPPDPVEQEFLRRGVPYERKSAMLVGFLTALGVEQIEMIPTRAVGTEAEGLLLPEWCEKRHFRSVVVITAPDHSRRVRRVLRRTMAGTLTRVCVTPTPYSEFEANSWWRTRESARVGIVELEKLVLDVARHPLS